MEETRPNGKESEPEGELVETQPVQAMTIPLGAVGVMTRAEIDVAIATAKQYPRPELPVITQRITSMATFNDEAAADCIYVLKRRGRGAGGQFETKEIKGPSVRLAEVIVTCYGNIRCGSRPTANDGQFVESQGFCFDLENNSQNSVTVQRPIVNREGRTYSLDMQAMATNANNSIARRDAILQTVPRLVWWPAYQACLKVVMGDAENLIERRTKMLAAFHSIGVVEEDILRALERESADSITLEDIATLAGYWTAIKDGMITAEEAFAEPVEPAEGEPVAKTFKERMRDLKAQRQKRRNK